MMRDRIHSLRSSTIRALLTAGLLLWGSASLAADGDLDPSFGTLGKVTTSLATFSSGVDVAVQADGKIVVVGTLSSGDLFEPPVLVLLRYASTGALDGSFNGVGYVTAQVPMFGGNGVALAIQPDGRIVALGLSGTVTHGASAMFVVRYESDGTPDATLGGDGMVEPTSLVAGAGDIAVIDTGELLVSYTGADASFNLYTRVLRLLDDGTLDPSFGTGGIADLPGFPFGGAATMALRDDGKILVGTSNLMAISPSFVTAFAAGRLSSTGVADTSFGSGGISPAFGDPLYVPGASTAIALQLDGRPVLAGATGGAFALVGMGAAGGPDTSFAGGGVFTDAFAAQATAILAHGGMFLAAGGNPQFALARVSAGGALDPSFATGGRVTTSFGDPFSIATAIAVQDDGAIVAVGSTGSSTASSIALARYLGTALGCTTGPDTDDDGVCDADDECPNGSVFTRARLVSADLQPPACDDRLVLNGTLALSASAAIDPGANGLRIVVRDGAGTVVVDETLPPGAYEEATQTGWRTRTNPTSSTWKFTRPSAGGAALTRAVVQRRTSAPDAVKVLIKGHAVCFAALPASVPLRATVVLTPPRALDERCGDARFPGSPGPACTVRSGGRKIACR